MLDGGTIPGGPSWPSDRLGSELRYAAEIGDHDCFLAKLEVAPGVAWFALDPHELPPLLTRAAEGARRPPGGAVLELLRLIRAGDDDPRCGPPGHAPSQTGCHIVEARLMRLTDRPLEAARILTHPGPAWQDHSSHEDVLFTSTLHALELGNAQLLSGEFLPALISFQSVLQRPHFGFPFLLRAARTKAAILHALFGDHRTAEAHLEVAAQVQRTGSWFEAHIDALEALARAALAKDSTGISGFARLPTHLIGEDWPLHAWAEQRAYLRAHRSHEAALAYAVKAGAHESGTRGDGLPGSVRDLILANIGLTVKNLQAARTHLSRVDPSLVLSRLLEARIDTVDGRATSALAISRELGHRTAGLRALDVERAAIAADAEFRTQRVGAAIDVLRQADSDWGGLTPAELAEFPAAIRPSIPTGPDAAREHRPRLTRREAEVLRALATGTSRRATAARLFISENTLKTHQRSLFRKLNAASRIEAVAVGARLGLLPAQQHVEEPTAGREPATPG